VKLSLAKISLTALAATAALLAVHPAAAQPAAAPVAPVAAKPGTTKPAVVRSDPKAPVDITADQLEIHNNDCEYVYTGSAEALQDNSRLRSDILIGHLEKMAKPKGAGPTANGDSGNTCGDLVSVEAKGNVYYVAADGRRVHGDNGIYDAASTTITITGDVSAVDASNNVMRGTKMVYNTQTGEGHVEGGAKGPNAKNRPRGVFYPKSNDQKADTSDQDQPPPAKKKKAAQ
jgi:lipopolysaccharide export system protein LptA